MVRVLLWGKLSKISSEDKINLIFDVLMPASYLRGLNKDKKELDKINFYKREAKKLLKSPDIEFHKKQEFLHLLKDCDFSLWD
ncbi:MAG: hypothetical protein KAT28_05275 [Candidatus Aenigmarchaeota archaeon]|nr:hypothetical protein [Candidatus Aenigmarchaeota archaeon]